MEAYIIFVLYTHTLWQMCAFITSHVSLVKTQNMHVRAYLLFIIIQ